MSDRVNGNEGEFISLKEAEAFTARARAKGGMSAFEGKKGFYVGQRKLQRLLSQDDAVGFRAYFGVDGKGYPQMAIVAVDQEGNDILRPYTGVEVASEALVLDNVLWCPPFCGNGNGLNG